MEVDTKSVELVAEAHFAGEQTTEDNHMLRWELKTQLYLTPEAEGQMFYPFHRYSTVVSIQNPQVDDIETTLFWQDGDSKSSTIEFDDGQMIVKGPGLVMMRWKGVTENEVEVYMSEGFTGGVPEEFSCNGAFSIDWSAARDETDDLDVSGTLSWDDNMVGRRTVGYWKLAEE